MPVNCHRFIVLQYWEHFRSEKDFFFPHTRNPLENKGKKKKKENKEKKKEKNLSLF